MIGITAGPAYAGCRDAVRALMEAGQPFGEVEAAIDGTDLEPDAKSALWLLAFSMRDSAGRQRDARAAIASLT